MTAGRMTIKVGACALAAGLTGVGSGPPASAARPPRALCATRPAPPSPAPGARGGRTVLPAVTTGRDVWNFVSDPRLHPMRVTVTAQRPNTAGGLIFVTPSSMGRMIGQAGLLILSNSGSPVWFRPLPSANLGNTDFRVQAYHRFRTGTAKPVLTWWQGTIAGSPMYSNLPPGAPEPGGCYYIYDTRYRLVRTISARNGFNADEHEFLLTSYGAALFIAAKPVRRDLRRYGGPQHGAIEDYEAQEVSLATGRLVFSWDMLRHVNPADSEVPASTARSSAGVWDPYHMNSIDPGPGGQLLISARHMWAVYDISKRTGKIRWQLGGKKSNFVLPKNAAFYWQHDARFRPGGSIGMFDNGCCNTPIRKPLQQSHGLILRLDFRRHRATAIRSYYHQPGLYSSSQGNVQALSNGDEFIGWGERGYYSEYAAAGNSESHGSVSLLYDAKMPGADLSYRAFRNVWTATPFYAPSAAAQASGSHSVVYASWNGSTETGAWQVLAGRNRNSLSVVVPHARRTGFETAVATASRGPYFQVKALNAAGEVLGSSQVVRLPAG